MNWYLLTLFVSPPLLALLYAITEYSGILDQWSGRRSAVDALNRLKSAKGFPDSWLYDDDTDRKHFAAIEKRISKRTTAKKVKDVLAKGQKPSCIVVGGEPILISGVPPEWAVDEKRAYLPDHSVIYLFGVSRTGGTGKAERVCTIGEIEKWLADEKDARKHYLGAIALGLISVAFILARVGVAS